MNILCQLKPTTNYIHHKVIWHLLKIRQLLFSRGFFLLVVIFAAQVCVFFLGQGCLGRWRGCYVKRHLCAARWLDTRIYYGRLRRRTLQTHQVWIRDDSHLLQVTLKIQEFNFTKLKCIPLRHLYKDDVD